MPTETRQFDGFRVSCTFAGIFYYRHHSDFDFHLTLPLQMCTSTAHQVAVITAAHLQPGETIGCDRGGISSPSSSSVIKRTHNSTPAAPPTLTLARTKAVALAPCYNASSDRSLFSFNFKVFVERGDKRHKSIQVESQSYRHPAYCFSIIAHLHEMDVAAGNRAVFLDSVLRSKWAAILLCGVRNQ